MFCSSCHESSGRYARTPDAPGARYCAACALAYGLDVAEGGPHYCETLAQCFPTLRDLFRAMVGGHLDDIDWADLPSYGGAAPADARNVWSWDAAHIVVGTCHDDLRLMPRHVSGWAAVDAALRHGSTLTTDDGTPVGLDDARERCVANPDSVRSVL